MIQGLSSNHLTHISSQSTFSFLTHIKFVSLTEDEIKEVSDEIKNLSHIYVAFNTVTAHILFALYVAILSISFVSFIVFFNVLLS
jgi:hypothetical protein